MREKEATSTKPNYVQQLKEMIPSDWEETVNTQRQEELVKVMKFWPMYSNDKIMKYLTVSNGVMEDGTVDINLQGRLVLNIPAEEFHTQHSGFFQLKLLWPKLDVETQTVTCKLSLSYKTGEDGKAIELTTGGRSAIPFTSINSSTYNLDDLLQYGYFDESIKDRIVQFALTKLDLTRAIMPLVPTGPVTIVLRNVIRPLNGVDDSIKTELEPGADAGIGMAGIGFENAMLLPAISSFLNPKPVDYQQPRTINELRDSYLTRNNRNSQRPVPSNDSTTDNDTSYLEDLSF
jgi:hypothetical protein